jgi:hypothetical protein
VPPEPNGDQPAARFDPSVTVPATAGPTGGQAPATGVAPTVLAPGAAEGPTQEPASHRPARPGDLLARQVLPQLCRGPWRHLRQAVEALGDDPEDAALHQVRIRSKRLRYATEAAEGVIGKPARKLASAAADLQGVLGDLNDAVVAEAWLRTNAERAPSSQALVAGELITTQRQRQGAGREHWAKAWKAVNHPGLRAWLK